MAGFKKSDTEELKETRGRDAVGAKATRAFLNRFIINNAIIGDHE